MTHLRETFRRRRPRQILALAKLAGWWETCRFLFQRAAGLPLVSLRLPEIAHPVFLRPGTSDWTALRHVIEERDSDVPLDRPPHFIIDGGANVGFASVLLANKYPRAKILAVEPHRDNAVLLRLNCRGYANVELVQSALWSSKTSLEIANPESDIHGGFQVRESAAGFEATTIAELLERSGEPRIDLLKLDVEGAETELFSRGFESWLGKVDALVIEIHGPVAEKTVRDTLAASGEFRASQRGEKLVFHRAATRPSG